MSHRKRRRRLHHDEHELTRHRLMPAPDVANPRGSDGLHEADKGSSNTAEMILGLQRTRGNQYVRHLIEDMRGRQSQTTIHSSLRQALAPSIQRMTPNARSDIDTAKLSPESAMIMQEWAKQYQHWFVSQVIDMIAEQFQKYTEENKDQAKAQAEAGQSSNSSTDVGKQLQNAGGPDNNIFASLYRMQNGMPITPEFVPVNEWQVPDDVESIADLFGEEVGAFVKEEHSRFEAAQSADPKADNKSISTAQHLVNLLGANWHSWFPTVADPGSPPQ